MTVNSFQSEWGNVLSSDEVPSNSPVIKDDFQQTYQQGNILNQPKKHAPKRAFCSFVGCLTFFFPFLMNDPLENEGKTSGQVDVHIMPMLKQG